LVYRLSPNPFCCLACRGEIDPEGPGFDPELTQAIVYWRSLYEALYRLRLGSDECEAWAADRLRDPGGRVNREGREIIGRLQAGIPAYYWWFEDNSVEEYVPLADCPICNQPLEVREKPERRACETCRILL